MISTIDHYGTEKAYGWTRDDDDEVWYWSVPQDGEPEDVEFTERGTHTDHPIRKTGNVPDSVRAHAQSHIKVRL